MSPWVVRTARLAQMLGVMLVFAGFVPVLAFSLGILVPAAEASAMLALFPQIPWVDGAKFWWAPHAGVAFALAGLAVMLLGAAILRRQRPLFDAVRARKQDARRRAHLYGGMERLEPTLGNIGPVD
jgi:hypothetical protein